MLNHCLPWFALVCGLLTGFLDAPVHAADPAKAEDAAWSVYPQPLPDRASALRFNIDACVALTRQRSAPASKAEWEARRGTIEAGLARAMGLEPRPPATPLEARVTGRAEREGYAVENVVFQSRPQFYVSANVYIPKDAPKPCPAVVVVAGHSMREGKNYDSYRAAQLALVRQGFLVLAHDPIGQGERQRPGYGHQVGYPALLTGMTNEGVIVWDTIRAVDYLLTRNDVDPKHIGLAGNSGGGENTFYTMPLEPRFAAGASCCFVCSYEAWIADGGNHCICNHLPGICRQMEEFEIIGLCAPRAFLAVNGIKDPIFPIAGAQKTIERARQVYGFYEAADRADLRSFPLPHGWAPPLREAACGWLGRWVKGQGDGSPLTEAKVDLENWQSKDLQCFKDGNLPADAKSYVDLIRAEADRLIASYTPVPAERSAAADWAQALRQRLWDALGGRPAPAQVAASSRGTFAWEGRSVERLAIQTEANLEVPALLVRPAKVSGKTPVVILLDDDGKAAVRRSPVARGLLDRGLAVLALDPRALGEVKVHDNHCASDAILLGRPLLVQQAWDVLAAARYLAGREDVAPGQIAVFGRGNVGLIALLAGALEPQIGAVALEGTLGSFRHAIADPPPRPLWLYAPGILKVADIPQLAALCAPRPLVWLNPAGQSGSLGGPQVTELAAPAAASYAAAGAQSALRVQPGNLPADELVSFLEAAMKKHTRN
jgi:dienelactone hydrolase